MRSLLLEAGSDLSDDPPTLAMEHLPDARYEAAPDKYITQELYAGYDRGDFQREYYGVGFVGQHEYYEAPEPDAGTGGARIPGARPAYISRDHGAMRGSGPSIREEAGTLRIILRLVYSARTANVVMSSEGEEAG